jgi:hypothetical protein
MDFIDEIKNLSERIKLNRENIHTEEATKMSLVLPFFQILGYDIFNSTEFYPEYTLDMDIKKDEKVDYAILKDNNPQILIECKCCEESLDKYDSQLFSCFSTTTAKFGILTNGIIYRFFTDLEEINKIDSNPFLEIDLLNIQDNHITELQKFCKENFNSDSIISSILDLKYSKIIKDKLQKELENPSEDFIKFILSDTYLKPKTQKVIDEFNPIVKKVFNYFINQKTVSGLDIKNETEPEVIVQDNSNADTEEDSKIVTTEDELQAFYLIKENNG